MIKVEDVEGIILAERENRERDYVEDGIKVWDSMVGELPRYDIFMRFYVDNRHRQFEEKARWN